MTAPEGTTEPDAADASRLERRVGLGLLGAAAVLFPLLLTRGWARWNDPLVDFGRELYVPWRLGAGDVLYRDLAYFNGPLSPYLNALWFALGGASLRTLLIANVGITCVTGLLLWRVLRRAGGPVAAGLGLLFFLPVFACGHFPGIGNYNFLSPYSHELTHGLALALGALLAIVGWRPPESPPTEARPTSSARRLWLAGALVGLAFLTKPEIFVAAVAGVGVAFVGALRAAGLGPGRALTHLAHLALPTLAVPVAAVAALAPALGLADAAAGTLTGWSGIFASDVAELSFYTRSMGLDRPAENARALAASFGWFALFLGVGAAVELATRARGPALRRGLGLAAAGVSAACLFALTPTLAPLDDPRRAFPHLFGQILPFWQGWSRHLPLTGLLGLAAAFVLGWRARAPEARRRWFARAAWAALGTALCAKVVLNTSFAHYGFALAPLAALVAITIGAEWIPRAIGREHGPGWVLRGMLLGALIAGASLSWRLTERSFAQKTVAVADGPDRFWADARGAGVVAALTAVGERLGPDDTLLVLPEGIMINYLARLRTPTRHINFMPPELILFGEETILAELRAAPPSATLLVHKDTSEYGYPLFGQHPDYGQAILRWLKGRYRQGSILIGQPPLEPGTSFGVGLLE